jgi:hypothetical protein
MNEILEFLIYLYFGILIGQINLFGFMFSSLSVSIVSFVVLFIILIPRLGKRGAFLVLGFYISNFYARFF